MMFPILSQLNKLKPELKTDYILHIKKNTKSKEYFTKCEMKQTGVSL